LEWLQATPRFRRNRGSDHVFLVNAISSWESYWSLKPPGALRLAQQQRQIYLPATDVVHGITRSSILASVEERRTVDQRGNSSVIAIPYYANSSMYFASPHHARSHLVGFAGSRELNTWNVCDACAVVGMNVTNGGVIRAKLFDEFASDCMAEECDVVDMASVVKKDRREVQAPSTSLLRAGDSSSFKSHGLLLNEILQNATFCPIPRGDSGGTKRFFAAILAGCIPVVISDNLALPFVPLVNYSGAILRVPEREFMNRKFSLLTFLRSQTPEQVAGMRENLSRIQRAITYSHGCSSLTEEYGSCSKEGDPAPDAVDHFVISLLQLHQGKQKNPSYTVADYFSDTSAL